MQKLSSLSATQQCYYGLQVEADYGRPKDGLGRVVSEHDLQALAVERAGGPKGPYAGVKRPNPGMGNQPGPLTLLVKVLTHMAKVQQSSNSCLSGSLQ